MSDIGNVSLNEQSKVKYRSFADETPELSGLEARTNGIGKGTLSQSATTSLKNLDEYKILPKAFSFWRWLGSFLLSLVTCWACRQDDIDEGVKNNVLDAEILNRLGNECKTQIDQYVKKAVSDALAAKDADGVPDEFTGVVLDIVQDIEERSTEIPNGEDVQEIKLNFKEVNGLHIADDEITRNAMRDKLTLLRDDLREDFNLRSVDKNLVLGTLQREFSSYPRILSILTQLDEAVQLGQIDAEEKNEIIRILRAENKETREPLLSAASATNIAVRTLSEALQPLIESEEDKDLLCVLSTYGSEDWDENEITSQNIKSVIAWVADFVERYKPVIEAKIKAEIDHSLAVQLKDQLKLVVPNESLEVLEVAEENAIREDIEFRIQLTLSNLVRNAEKAASGQYPQTAELKAFEQVFGITDTFEIEESCLSALASEVIFPVDAALRKQASNDPIQLRTLRERFIGEELKGMVLKVYNASFKEKYITLDQKSAEYLEKVKEKAITKIEKAIEYHVAEQARVELKSTKTPEEKKAALLSIASEVAALAIGEWIAVYPDLIDFKDLLTQEFSNDNLEEIVDQCFDQTIEGLESQINALGNAQIDARIGDKVAELFNEKANAFFKAKLLEKVKALETLFPNNVECNLRAMADLSQDKANLIRELTSLIVTEAKPWIEQELEVNEYDYDSDIQDFVKNLVESKMQRMTDTAQVKYEAGLQINKRAVESYRTSGINTWIEDSLKKLPKAAADTNETVAQYEALSTLVRDPSAQLELTDEARLSLSAEAIRLQKAYQKSHPDLMSTLNEELSKEAFETALLAELKTRLEALHAQIDVIASDETDQFIAHLSDDSVINQALEGIIQLRFGVFSNLLVAIDADITSINEDFNAFFRGYVPLLKLTADSKKQILDYYSDELLKITVDRMIKAMIVKERYIAWIVKDDEIQKLKKQQDQHIQHQMPLQLGHGLAEINGQLTALKAQKAELKIKLNEAIAAKLYADFCEELYHFEITMEEDGGSVDEAALREYMKDFIDQASKELGNQEIVKSWLEAAVQQLAA